MKLSSTQLMVLEKLAKPEAKAHYMRYMGSFQPNPYWILPIGKARVSTMNKLHSFGLIQINRDEMGYPDIAIISQKGLKMIKKAIGIGGD